MIVFFLSQLLFADYRVYELNVSNQVTGESRVVTSTLDQIQYPSYYPLQPNESIAYKQSWMCFGNFSKFKKHCPNPKASDND